MQILNESLCTFWKTEDVFSNWHPSKFEHKGTQFECAEQALMFFKAYMFGDPETADKILSAKHPKEMKALGRQVSNFDEVVWEANREQLMFEILCSKFHQTRI